MPKLRQLRAISKPPILKTFAAFPTGKRIYKYGQTKDIRGGPGKPPDGFLQATNSLSEWMIYWAMFKALQIPVDPRKSGPPFMGLMPYFTYQWQIQGGRQLGGSVPDFVIYRTPTGVPVVVRVVTEYWHLFTTNAKQVKDTLQRQKIDTDFEVIDIYDFDFVWDETGAAAVKVVKSAAGLIERMDPLRAGTAERNRRKR